MKNKNLIIVFIILIAIFGVGAFTYNSGLLQQTSFQGEEVTLLVPHLAALKCEVIDHITLMYSVPETGFILDKTSIGFKSKIVSNIIVAKSSGASNLVVSTCSLSSGTCSETKYQGDGPHSLPSIDVSQYYYKIQFFKINYIFQYKPYIGSSISYSAEKYGLNLYSTTGGFKTVCYSSCDLSCPVQEIRKTIVETYANTLNFYESTNYIEYWATPTQIGEQFGGTVWDANTQQFCFGGFIYNAGTITNDIGTSYLYPSAYITKKDCCNGARVDLTQGYKICENNNWRTILPVETPQCTSVIECPGRGIPSGQLLNGQTIKINYICSSGKCIQQTPQVVDCIAPNIGCLSDEVCENFKCVGGNTQDIPLNITPNPEPELICNSVFQQPYTSTSKDYGFLGWRGAVNMPITREESGCKTASWIWIMILGVIAAIVLLIIISMFRKKPKRGRR